MKLDYQVVNKIEISPQSLNIELVREKGRYCGNSNNETEIGIVSNDGNEKKLLIEQTRGFSSDAALELLVCCEGNAVLKNTGFITIKNEQPVVLVEKIGAFCNESKIPISYTVQTQKHITSKARQCAVQYTLIDH